jgi:signal transduction histidine kinase
MGRYQSMHRWAVCLMLLLAFAGLALLLQLFPSAFFLIIGTFDVRNWPRTAGFWLNWLVLVALVAIRFVPALVREWRERRERRELDLAGKTEQVEIPAADG